VEHLDQPHFPNLLRCFLYNQTHTDANIADDVPIDNYLSIHSRIYVYHSAVAQFYAPNDLCGTGGMCYERIRSNPSWHGKSP
jgi:hypothetical protein